MYISQISLVNYRNFANAKFIFKKGVNTIIGENGSGKSNLFRALRLMLDDTFSHLAYQIDEGDFNRFRGDWRGHWIIISIEFSDLVNDEAIQSLFKHGIGQLDGEESKATYNLYFRPKADIRKKLSELTKGDVDGLSTVIEEITIEDYESAFTGKSTVDFNDPNVYKSLVGNFATVEFDDRIDEALYGTKIPNQLSVAKEVSFTFIKALRDVVADFNNNRKNPLLKLLKYKSGQIDETAFKSISDLVEQLNIAIENLPDVQDIRQDIRKTILATVGATYSPSKLSIKSNLPREADKLLQSLKLFIGEPNETYEGGLHELSLGGANLIFLTLKLLEYQYRSEDQMLANFLVIEEPEAHIHTHIQKTLFDRLNFSDTQIIYSTHSTHISNVSHVERVNILAKQKNYSEVYQPANQLDPKNVNQVQRYLDAVRSNLLFAKGVILVEGDAEEILIPIMVKKVFGVGIDELGISIINIGSTGFKNVAQLFHESRVKRNCAILTDLDAAICDTTTSEEDTDTQRKYKDKVRRSAEKGAARKENLDEFVADNTFLEAFYADYTFEVDFVQAGNSWEVVQLLNTIYTDSNTIKNSKEELNSSQASQYGKRVLIMAQNAGKGWFAIMLGEHINYQTVVPNYILQAIVFAKKEFSNYLLSSIVQHRLDAIKGSDEGDDYDFNAIEEELRDIIDDSLFIDTLLHKLEELIPDDIIITFLKLL